MFSSSLISHSRGGYTLVEMMLAVSISALLMLISLPSMSRAIQTRQADRSVRVIGTDLLLAQSLAARQRSPIRVALDVGNRQYVFIQRTTGDTLHTRSFGPGSDLQVERLSFTPAVVDIMPSGISSSALAIKVTAGKSDHALTVSRAGQIRTK